MSISALRIGAASLLAAFAFSAHSTTPDNRSKDPLYQQLETQKKAIEKKSSPSRSSASNFDPDFLRRITDTQAIADAIAQSQDMKALNPKISAKDLKFAQEQAERASYAAAAAIAEQARINGQEVADGTGQEQQSKWSDQGITLVAVSSSMPRDSLRSLIESTAGLPRTAIVVRGLFPGDKTINQTLENIRQIALGLRRTGEVYIDPTVFADYEVTVVPTVILTGDEPGKPAGRMEGQFNLNYFKDQLKSRKLDKKDGNIGRVGPVFDIAERDITEEMKERLSKVDINGKVDKALSRFWKDDRFQSMPRAQHARTRRFEPEYVVKKDIPSTQPGQLIAKAGTKINPLKSVPMTRRIFVFDGKDQRQLERVKLESASRTDRRVPIYMITGLPTGDEGWKAYERIQNFLGAHIYVLPRELVRTFRIESVPSVVTSEGNELIVEELEIPS